MEQKVAVDQLIDNLLQERAEQAGLVSRDNSNQVINEVLEELVAKFGYDTIFNDILLYNAVLASLQYGLVNKFERVKEKIFDLVSVYIKLLKENPSAAGWFITRVMENPYDYLAKLSEANWLALPSMHHKYFSENDWLYNKYIKYIDDSNVVADICIWIGSDIDKNTSMVVYTSYNNIPLFASNVSIKNKQYQYDAIISTSTKLSALFNVENMRNFRDYFGKLSDYVGHLRWRDIFNNIVGEVNRYDNRIVPSQLISKVAENMYFSLAYTAY